MSNKTSEETGNKAKDLDTFICLINGVPNRSESNFLRHIFLHLKQLMYNCVLYSKLWKSSQFI